MTSTTRTTSTSGLISTSSTSLTTTCPMGAITRSDEGVYLKSDPMIQVSETTDKKTRRASESAFEKSKIGSLGNKLHGRKRSESYFDKKANQENAEPSQVKKKSSKDGLTLPLKGYLTSHHHDKDSYKGKELSTSPKGTSLKGSQKESSLISPKVSPRGREIPNAHNDREGTISPIRRTQRPEEGSIQRGKGRENSFSPMRKHRSLNHITSSSNDSSTISESSDSIKNYADISINSEKKVYFDFSENDIESDKEKNYKSLLISELKRKNKKLLSHIFDCVKRSCECEGLTLRFNSNGGLYCSSKPHSDAENDRVIAYLYSAIMDAITWENTTFFNRNDSLIRIENIHECILKKYPKVDALYTRFKNEFPSSNPVMKDPKRASALEILLLSHFKLLQSIFISDKIKCENINMPLVEQGTCSLFPELVSFLNLKPLKIDFKKESLQHFGIECKDEEDLGEPQKVLLLADAKNRELINDKQKIIDFLSLPSATKAELVQFKREIRECVNISELSKPVLNIQKISLLYFYLDRLNDYFNFIEFIRRWSDLGLKNHDFDIIRIKENDLKIKIEDQFHEIPYLADLCDEINSFIIYRSHPPSNTYLIMPGVNFDSLTEIMDEKSEYIDIEDFLMNLPDENSSQMIIALKTITKDLKMLAARTFENLTFHTCSIVANIAKPPHLTAKYFDGLFYLVKKSFDSIYKKYQEKPYLLEQESSKLYTFFIKVASKLVKIHDYNSSHAILLALENPAISWITNNNELISQDIKNKLNSLLETFDGNNFFENIRNKIEDCKKNKIFYVPLAAILYTYQLQQAYKLKAEVTAMSLKIHNFNNEFKDLRDHLEIALQNHTPGSNISEAINQFTKEFELDKPAFLIKDPYEIKEEKVKSQGEIPVLGNTTEIFFETSESKTLSSEKK